MSDRELLWQALEALDAMRCTDLMMAGFDSLPDRIRIRLAESEEVEPVAWMSKGGAIIPFHCCASERERYTIPLYRHPAPHPAVRLSDEEIRKSCLEHEFTIKEGLTDLKPYVYETIRSIEKLVLSKNRLEVENE